MNCYQFMSSNKGSFTIVNYCSKMGFFCNSLLTWVWGDGS